MVWARLRQVREVEGYAPEGRPDPRAIFEEYFDYVWTTLRYLGAREADLEDLTHEVFMRVFDRLDHFDTARPMRPWLFAFAYRIASEQRRLTRRRGEVLGSGVEAVDASPSAELAMERAEERKLTLEALEAIELSRRAVFVLHELDDVPIPSVAEALGIPIPTAYSRLRLAREDFQKALRRLRLVRGDR
jgi:RNA polymerase sigma-70 factor (ECF subfamily)